MPAAKSRVFLVAVTLIALTGVLLLTLRVTKQVGVYPVPNDSMAPFIHKGDTLMVQALSLHLGPVQRGDVVTFSQSGDERPDLDLKRVVGLPGDKVQLVDGTLRINDKPASDFYDTSKIKYTDLGSFQGGGAAHLNQPYTVPADHLLMLGDNSANSSDSRVWGPVPIKSVRHKYWFHIKHAAPSAPAAAEQGGK